LLIAGVVALFLELKKKKNKKLLEIVRNMTMWIKGFSNEVSYIDLAFVR